MAASQRPSCLPVVEAMPLQVCDIKIPPAMLRMALVTRPFRCHPAMIAFSVINPPSNLLMTIQALCPGYALKRLMTFVAIIVVVELGVHT